MSLSPQIMHKAQQLALSTCLFSWNKQESFETVLSKIGQNGSVVERTEYLNAKPELIKNTILQHLDSIIEFARSIELTTNN